MDDRLRQTKRKDALLWIAVFAAAKVVFHTIVNTHYGFHRDELATLSDARHLAWGFVAYPPLTPFIGAVELSLFGESLAGFRFFAAVAQSVVVILSADIAKQIGGSRTAQWITALAVAAGPVSIASSSLFQYVSFDLLWWVLIAWSLVRLIQSDDQRYWLAIGAAIGLGFLTKYAIGICVAGLLVGFVFSPLRKQITSKWLWAGAGVALLIALPNIIWQIQNDFISLEFLKSIHARDIAIGRTDDFLFKQLWVSASFAAVPFWACGLYALLFDRSLKRFRPLALMAITSIALFVVLKGRDYYSAPIYPPLIAAGSAWIFNRLEDRASLFRWTAAVSGTIIVASMVLYAAIITPVAPIGTLWFARATQINGDLREEIGWPELAGEIERVWNTISDDERKRSAIFCSNYGEAGAIELYGPHLGLPNAISPVNSFWVRGYGDPPPETVIAVGFRKERLEEMFEAVEIAGQIPNPLNIANEESGRPEIYICRRLRRPWSDVWPTIRSFG